MLQKSYVFLRTDDRENIFISFGNYGFNILVSLLFSAGSAIPLLWDSAVCRKLRKEAVKTWRFLTLLPNFPPIGGCRAVQKGAHHNEQITFIYPLKCYLFTKSVTAILIEATMNLSRLINRTSLGTYPISSNASVI